MGFEEGEGDLLTRRLQGVAPQVSLKDTLKFESEKNKGLTWFGLAVQVVQATANIPTMIRNAANRKHGKSKDVR